MPFSLHPGETIYFIYIRKASNKQKLLYVLWHVRLASTDLGVDKSY